MDDIEKEIEQEWRDKIADQIVECFHTTNPNLKDDDYEQRVYWFNQGMAYASMVARFGL